LKTRFFDVDDPDILAITTNYLCNEWLSEADLNEFEKMKVRNPRRYRVAGLGEWGIVDGLIYENWKELDFRLVTQSELKDIPVEDRHNCVIRDKLKTRCGLDFGYTNDPTASPIMFLDAENKKLYIWDELYQKGLSNRKIFQELSSMGYGKERFTGDSAEPKSIDELKGLGLRIKGAKKGKDSVKNGIQWIQDLEIIVHPRCVNFLTEISNYTWDKDKFGKTLNTPIDDFNHLMDAMRYGLEDDIVGNTWIY
jgi:phage terminase large subunit